MNWFFNLSTRNQIIIIIFIVLILIFLYRRYGYRIKNLFQPKEINKETIKLINGQIVTVSSQADLPQSQKTYLENLAGRIKKDVKGTNALGYRDSAVYKEAAGLSDVEIDYMASYYKRYLTSGVSMYEDMSDEWLSYFQDNSGFNDLLIKLEKTGNR